MSICWLDKFVFCDILQSLLRGSAEAEKMFISEPDGSKHGGAEMKDMAEKEIGRRAEIFKRFFEKDFPWLYAIRRKWDPHLFECIEARNASIEEPFFSSLIIERLSPDSMQESMIKEVYLKISQSQKGEVVRVEPNINSDGETYKLCRNIIINYSSLSVDYIVFVLKGKYDKEKERIYIYRRPKRISFDEILWNFR